MSVYCFNYQVHDAHVLGLVLRLTISEIVWPSPMEPKEAELILYQAELLVPNRRAPNLPQT